MKILNNQSVSLLIKSSSQTIKLYPATMGIAFFAAILGVVCVDGQFKNPLWIKTLFFSLILGIPLFYNANVLMRFEWNPFNINKKIYPLLAFACLCLIYYLLYGKYEGNVFLHYVLYWFLLHLLISFSLFYKKDEVLGFWEYNKSLFIQFLVSTLYSASLWLGLSAIVGTAIYLFGLNINGKIFLQMWMVCVFLFQPWHFLGSLPIELSQFKSTQSYPKGLKIFTQYLLIPLLSAYMLILYIYMGSIIVSWNLPKGLISWMISVMSVLGVLNLLFIYPKEKETENKWIRTYSRYFYSALLPLIILMLIGALKRISDYGLTEKRYLLLAMGVWLFGIAIYFIISKAKNIRILPISLFLLTLLCTFGPWSAFNSSRKSQENKLEELLIKNKILKDGAFLKESDEISFEQEKRISSITEYLVDFHKAGAIRQWFKNSPQFKDSDLKFLSSAGDTIQMMGLEWRGRYDRGGKNGHMFRVVTPEIDAAISTRNYAFIYPFFENAIDEVNQFKKVTFGKEVYEVNINSLLEQIEVRKDDEDFALINLKELYISIQSKKKEQHFLDDHVSQSIMSAESSAKTFSIKLELERIEAYVDRTNDFKLKTIKGNIFLKKE
jgi:hypothetical protein